MKFSGKAFLYTAVFAALMAGGCATNLEPAPSAREAPGQGAVAMDEGIRLQAQADAWSGRPETLENQVTPILVTITNRGDTPVRVAYNQLRLVSAEGRRYSALPPFRIDGQVSVSVPQPYFPVTGFGFAPYMAPYGIAGPFYDGFAVNAPYWNTYGPVMRTVDLPTQDMMQKALPEGVLQPGGQVSGFVYFEGVGPDVRRVELRAEFKNPRTGAQVARLSIPFMVG